MDAENSFKYFLTLICTFSYRYLDKVSVLAKYLILKRKITCLSKKCCNIWMFYQLSEEGLSAALLTGRVDRRFLSSPKVFIRTFTSESESNWNNCSVLRPRKMSDLIFCSAWNAIFWKREISFAWFCFNLNLGFHSCSRLLSASIYPS